MRRHIAGRRAVAGLAVVMALGALTGCFGGRRAYYPPPPVYVGGGYRGGPNVQVVPGGPIRDSSGRTRGGFSTPGGTGSVRLRRDSGYSGGSAGGFSRGSGGQMGRRPGGFSTGR